MDHCLSGQRRLYQHACREASLTVMVWLAALLWTVGYCWLRGYPHAEGSWLVQLGLAARQPEVFPLRCALPNWVFWGIFIPWLACTAFTAVLSFFLPDDSLDS